MSKLDLLFGNDDTVSTLKSVLQTNNLAHAVVLSAPDGCGRNFAARCLAADWLYPQGGAGAEAVMRGESPEVLVAEGEGKSGQISVARIRAVRSDVFLSSLSAAGRVVHIKDAHQMAPPAYNALLKVLEEPPADVLFILTAQSAGALPATITSRCARYTLTPLSGEQCRERLRQRPAAAESPELPALLTAVYDGRLGLCLEVLAEPARLATLQDALAAAKACAGRNEYGLLCLLAKYEGRGDGEKDLREAFLFDLTCVLNAALRQIQAPGLPQIPSSAAALLLEPVMQARALLRGNAAPKIAFTAMTVAIAKAGLATA